MCVGCVAMYAVAFSGASVQVPLSPPISIVQRPTSAQLVRAAFTENKIVIKKNLNRPTV
jgi:hypothetical protein